jgi:glycosyltransferase involved in cell wall biosynthesis
LQAALKKKIAEAGFGERVEFAVFVQPEQMPEEFVKAGMFIPPSLKDTFGVVIAEVLASGTPVICSQFAGVSEYLQHGEDSLLIDPHDTAGLARCIALLLDDKEMRNSFRERGKAVAKQINASLAANIFLQGIAQTRYAP